MYAIPAESRRSATIARTSSSSVTRAPIDSARRPPESEIAPHPAEVMRGAALLTLTFGTVLHRLQEGDQLRAEALDLHRLARRTPAQRGQRGVGPRAVMPFVEIAEQPGLDRGRYRRWWDRLVVPASSRLPEGLVRGRAGPGPTPPQRLDERCTGPGARPGSRHEYHARRTPDAQPLRMPLT